MSVANVNNIMQERNAAFDFESQKSRDQEKREGCQSIGITLIEIPYWWDGTEEQLTSTIMKIRPDMYGS